MLCCVAAVVAVLQSPPTDAELPASVVEDGLRAIVNLVVGNDANRAKLTNQHAIAGACTLLTSYSSALFLDVGSPGHISYSPPLPTPPPVLFRSRRLCLSGMFAVVVAALESSLTLASPGVVKYGLWAIKNLAARNGERRALMGECGACAGCMLTICLLKVTVHCHPTQF